MYYHTYVPKEIFFETNEKVQKKPLDVFYFFAAIEFHGHFLFL